MLRDRFFRNLQMLDSAVARGSRQHRVKSINQFRSRAVVESERQNHAGVARSLLARPFHFFLHRRGKLVLSPDILQADVVLVQSGDFLFQVAGEQLHQEIHFGFGAALPVLLGKGVKRERGNADAGGALNRVADGGDPGTMSGDAGEVTLARPASVAVHDDGDVLWEPPWIKLPVYVGFFSIQSGGDGRDQKKTPSVSETNIGGRELQ